MNSAAQLSTLAIDEQTVLADYVADGNLDDIIPSLARDRNAMRRIEALVQGQQTTHELIHGDARSASALEKDSIHLVVTSPPYWTLKRYNEHDEQMGHIVEYDAFMAGLDEVWTN